MEIKKFVIDDEEITLVKTEEGDLYEFTFGEGPNGLFASVKKNGNYISREYSDTVNLYHSFGCAEVDEIVLNPYGQNPDQIINEARASLM